MKRPSKRSLGLVGLTTLGVLKLFSGTDAKAENPGCMIVTNRLNSHQRNVNLIRDDVNFSGAEDGYEGHDSIANSQPFDYPNFYSDIETHLLWDDFRQEDSNKPYDLDMGFEGTLAENQSNWLEFSFPYEENPFTGEGPYDFGGKPILFQQTNSTNPNAFYPVYDVRRAIENGEGVGIIALENVAAGDYTQFDPYASGRLDIGTRLLADLDDNGTVDLYDFAPIGNDWGQTNVNSIADISGPDGLPDRNVDMWDLKAYAEDYLMSIND